jgi:hypothetical protein
LFIITEKFHSLVYLMVDLVVVWSLAIFLYRSSSIHYPLGGLRPALWYCGRAFLDFGCGQVGFVKDDDFFEGEGEVLECCGEELLGIDEVL